MSNGCAANKQAHKFKLWLPHRMSGLDTPSDYILEVGSKTMNIIKGQHLVADSLPH
jgi:hypothetical protein